MKKLFILTMFLFSTIIFLSQSTYAYTNVGTQVIYANIEVQIDDNIKFEDSSNNFVAFDTTLTSWSGLMSISLNYLTVIYTLDNTYINFTNNENITYLFSNINVLTIYIVYESPLYLPMFTISIFDISGDIVYTDSNRPVAELPTLAFLYQLESSYNQAYDTGYIEGQDDMFNNGSTDNGYNVSDSFDFDIGVAVGTAQNVQAGLTTFSTNFDKWIVPAIIIVILLGGFITIYAKKNRGD